MLQSVRLRRIILVLDAVLFGIIVDGFTHLPWLGAAGGLSALSVVILLGRLARRLNSPWLDADTKAIIKLIVLVFIFFLECSLAAYLILS